MALVAALRRGHREPCPIVPLFGGDVDWQFGEWSEHSDRLGRGGNSFGDLVNASDGRATVQGVLDPSVLGAGYAGTQVTGEAFRAALPQLSGLSGTSGLSGLVLDIADGDGQPYTVGFRMEGNIGSHRIDFRGEAGLLRLPFQDFEEDCRGTPCPGVLGPLNFDRVIRVTISISALSPTENAGPFSLTLRSIGAYKETCDQV